MCRIHLDSQFNHHNPIQNSILKITPENLSSVIDQLEMRIFDIRIEENYQDYTPLEYAVKNDDLPSVLKLIELKKQCENPLFVEGQTIVHFFIENLKEDVEPNIHILSALIENVKDWNMKNSHTNTTPLESAFINMRMYKNVHWSVIKLLLKTENDALLKSNAFQAANQLGYGIKSNLTGQSPTYYEYIFINNLIEFQKIEKEINPNAQSFMSINDFKNHLRYSAIKFTNLTIVLNAVELFDRGLGEFSEQAIDRIKFFKTDFGQDRLLRTCLNHIGTYRNYFDKLVINGKIKDCFLQNEVNDVVLFLEGYRTIDSAMLLQLMDKLGLVEKIKENPLK
ncbi:MAG: hypothetical protein JHC93_03700 [Parachlamydiales bacterium]|nr:hypothetical protein [Parachlamydiales bacterium]